MVLSWYKVVVSKWVTRYWPLVIGGWIGLAIILRLIAPPWSEIAADGDLAFLPKTVPSAVGQRALEQAFPSMQARSQIVLVFAASEEKLGLGDLALAFDIARRLHWSAAKNALRAMGSPSLEALERASEVDLARQLDEQSRLTSADVDATEGERASAAGAGPQSITAEDPSSGTPDGPPGWGAFDAVQAEIAVDNLREAIEIEEVLAGYLQQQAPETAFLRLPDAYALRGLLQRQRGREEDRAQWLLDLDTAKLMREQNTPTLPAQTPAWAEDIRDVWSWRSRIVGHKLGSQEPAARLINIQLGTDFTATSNIETVQGIEDLIAELRPQYAGLASPNLRIELSGSAAVGADMLRAAASGVRKTEVVTIVLVLLILAAVYRAPFLVAIPLTSIALSLLVATSLIALMARDPTSATSSGLGVFTTTRIFVVVLLFGAGTDFCLFFLARNRELLANRSTPTRRRMMRIVANSWRSVHNALVASAATTIVGLGLMWFSDFQKFQFSGPIIAISLAVMLLVCLTFTPALLSGLGTLAFWPLLPARPALGSHKASDDAASSSGSGRNSDRVRQYWGVLANIVVSHPWAALCGTLLVLCVPAAYGAARLGHVTYDFTEELSASSPSRRGAALISRYFPTQDSSPVMVLLTKEQPFESEQALREACAELDAALYVDGVQSVRGLNDPLGDYPPGKRMGLFDRDAWRRRLLNRIAREHYVSGVEELQRRVARFDVVLSDNPFSLEAAATLERLRHELQQRVEASQSFWGQAGIAMAGTTVGITDLRAVTQADQTRIQILVTLGVWLVLILLLRQWVLASYLILTVLLSYFATLGVTYFVFSQLYGAEYGGLDWKVPLFLFVILVAVGQDYNVYLVTRIFEERLRHGVVGGVRRAVEFTGGIITSCGFVMAGTFVAMTSPAILLWLGQLLPEGWIDTTSPVLRGITELGFALAFGVLLDTLIVRSVLVPAFIVLWRPASAKSLVRGSPKSKLSEVR